MSSRTFSKRELSNYLKEHISYGLHDMTFSHRGVIHKLLIDDIPESHLFQLVKNNKIKELNWYIKNVNFDINYLDKKGESVLDISIKNKSNDCLKKLVEYGNISNSRYQSVFINAINDSNVDIVEFLIKKNITNILESKCNIHLIKAVKSSNFKIIQLLVSKAKVNVNIQDSDGTTALIEAVRNSRFDVIKLLVSKAKAKIDIQDSKGITALMEAVRKNRIDIARFLINSGKCNLDIKNNDNQTAQDILDEFQPGMSL